MQGRAKGPATDERTKSRGCGQDQAARATKYIEFHGGVRLPHEYLPARSLHVTGSAAAAGCRKQVWLTGKKLRQLVQIQIEV